MNHRLTERDGSPSPLSRNNLLLVLLLISGHFGLFQVLMNAEDIFKSSSCVENKRHTNAHQPSPPSQQQRLQSPFSASTMRSGCKSLNSSPAAASIPSYCL